MCTIFTILKQRLTKNTDVIIFSSTVHKDKNMIHIVKYLKKKKIPISIFTFFSSEDRENKLQEFYESLENNFSDSDSPNELGEEVTQINKYIMVDSSDFSDNKKVKKKKEPVYIVIFNDLSTKLKDRAVSYFMKQNRDFKFICILSSQYLFDLAKNGRNQIDYILMFPALPLEKVESIQKELDLNIPKKKNV